MLLKEHKLFYDQIFKIPNFLGEEILIIGNQIVAKGYDHTGETNYTTLHQMLETETHSNITVLDAYDAVAELTGPDYDLSEHAIVPITSDPNFRKYDTVIDIGCIEHVFNPVQALMNYENALKDHGKLMIHAPVKGYFGHGYHTFNPDFFLDYFRLNGWDILYCKYSSKSGAFLPDNTIKSYGGDALIWIVVQYNEPDYTRFPVQSKFMK